MFFCSWMDSPNWGHVLLQPCYFLFVAMACSICHCLALTGLWSGDIWYW